VLSERESEILRYLAANRGRTITREELLRRVWGIDPKGVQTRTVDMHIARLRESLLDDPADPKVIITVRSKGYMLGAEAALEGPGVERGATGSPPAMPVRPQARSGA
jgi:two-component system alkaline phosphatase synthesis response regulator PhoP